MSEDEMNEMAEVEMIADIDRKDEEITSLREQVRKLTEERGVAESRGPMTHENCAACIRSLDSAGMGKPGAPYGNTLTGMVAEACSELTSAKQQIEELATERDEALKRLETIVWQKEDWETRYHRDNSRLAARIAELEKERDEAVRVQEGYLKNIGSCPACAEGICCGSVSTTHVGCAYSERDVLASQCARLETENANLAIQRFDAHKRVAELESEAARLREDGKRLDKLEEWAKDYRDGYWGLIATVAPAATPGWKWIVKRKSADSLRAAIDDAMSERDGK